MRFSDLFEKFIDICMGIAIFSMCTALAITSVLVTIFLIKQTWLFIFN